MPPISQQSAPQNALMDYRSRKLELVYGRSRSGKTTWFLELAHYLRIKTGKKTRWYLGDGGGETIFNTGWCDGPEAFIEVYPYIIRDNPIETCQLICMGWWPENPEDPKTRMLPPTREILSSTGLWIYEGTTFMGDYMMGEKEGGMANRMGKGEVFNKDDSFRFKDGSLFFGGNSRTHYGYVQRKMLDCIGRTTMLPGIKGWTGHEVKVDDEDRREAMYGPDLVGTKLTPRIGGAFGNTVHLMSVITTEEIEDPTTKKKIKRTKEEHRAYFQDHYDPEAKVPTRYYANVRIDARIKEKFPELAPEYITPASPIRMYQILDLAKKKEAELVPDVKDLPDLEITGLVNTPSTTRGIML